VFSRIPLFGIGKRKAMTPTGTESSETYFADSEKRRGPWKATLKVGWVYRMQRIARVERACDAGPVGKIGREMAKIRQNYSATIENADGFKMRRIIDNFERRSSRRTHFSESFFYTEAREDGE
jgi:hypothetical protein